MANFNVFYSVNGDMYISPCFCVVYMLFVNTLTLIHSVLLLYFSVGFTLHCTSDADPNAQVEIGLWSK